MKSEKDVSFRVSANGDASRVSGRLKPGGCGKGVRGMLENTDDSKAMMTPSGMRSIEMEFVLKKENTPEKGLAPR